MVNLNIINNFELNNLGINIAGQQGIPGGGSAPTDPFLLSVNGQSQMTPGTLATATAQKIWDAAINVPATFAYFFFVADQNCYLQFITSATNFIVLTVAGVPFVLSSQSMLAAAATTAMTGTTPTVTSIAKIYAQQNSGVTSNFQGAVIL